MPGPTVLLLREALPTGPFPTGCSEIDAIAPASLRELAERAWYWPEAAEALARARCAIRFERALVAPTPIDEALLVTARAAELAKEPGVLAVVWEPTGLVHDPQAFVNQSADASKEDLPLYLWVRFEGTKADDGTLGMRTTGLAALGAMEVEVEGSTRDGEQILESVTDIALFLLAVGAPPEDGETIEVTRGELRVRRMPSLRGDGSIALRVRV